MSTEYDFTKGNIFKKMIGFMLPILAALVLQSMYSAVDLLIVGQFGTEEGISGVSTGAAILHSFTIVITSLSTGVTVLMGHYLGNKEPNKIGKLLSEAIMFFTIVGVILSFVLIFFSRDIAILMQSPKESLNATTEYIRICGIGFIFVVFYNLISCIFRGLGNSKLPFIFVGIACIVNILGDFLLVAVLKMNVAGAAIATIVSQAISVFISLIVIKKQKLPFEIKKEDFHFTSETARFLKIGAPLVLQEVLTNFTFLAICAFVNNLGLDASSGYGVAQRIVSFVMLVPSSIIQSMSSFVAQNVGAKDEKRATKAMLCGMLIGVSIGIPISILAFFKGDLLAAIFTDNTAYIVRAFEYLRGFAVEAILTSILFSFLGYFNGHSKSAFVMIQGMIQSLLIRLPASYIMSIQENASLTYIGLAIPAATIIGITMSTVYFLIIKKLMAKQKSSNSLKI